MNISINVQPNPSITGTSTVCQNTSQAYSVSAVAGSAFNWSVNGGNITSGAGTNSVTVNWTTAGTGRLSVAQGVGACVGTTSTAIIVNAAPAVPNVFKAGDVLSTDAVGTFQWYKDGVAISGATASSYTATAKGNYYGCSW